MGCDPFQIFFVSKTSGFLLLVGNWHAKLGGTCRHVRLCKLGALRRLQVHIIFAVDQRPRLNVSCLSRNLSSKHRPTCLQ